MKLVLHWPLLCMVLAAHILFFTGSVYPQGWIEITPPELARIDRFQRFDSELHGYEIYAWGDVGYRFRRTSQPVGFVSYWASVCDPEPPGYGEVPWSLGSIAKVSDDPPLLLSMYSTPGCIFVVSGANMYLDSVVLNRTWIHGFDLYGLEYCPAVVAVKPYLPTSVYVHAADSIYHSNDGGNSFLGLSRICTLPSDFACPEFLIFHPQVDGLSFAGGRNRGCGSGYLFRTTDNGLNWTPVLDFRARTFLFDPYSFDVFYVASDSGLYKTQDGGDNWWRIKQGAVASIEIGRPDHDLLYAGSLSGELWRSTNAGVRWTLYNNSFTDSAIIGLHKDVDSDTVIACATDGVFKVYAPFVVSVDDELPSIPLEIHLRQNYPNPFNPVTTIVFAIPRTLHVRLVVYNVLGQQVDVLVDEVLNSGWHSKSFDGGELSSGTYFYRLIAGESAFTRRMVLQR
jgi:hypothetical protein